MPERHLAFIVNEGRVKTFALLNYGRQPRQSCVGVIKDNVYDIWCTN